MYACMYVYEYKWHICSWLHMVCICLHVYMYVMKNTHICICVCVKKSNLQSPLCSLKSTAIWGHHIAT